MRTGRFSWVVFFLLLLTVQSGYGQRPIEKVLRNFNQKAEQLIFSRPDSAFVYANNALSLAIERESKADQGDSHQIIGTVLYHQGVYLSSLQHLLEADNLFRALKDFGKLAASQNQLGLVYYSIRQIDRAYVVHREALQLYKTIGDQEGIAYSYGCIGRLFEKAQRYDSAIAYQEKALVIYTEAKNEKGEATILENIGSIYEDQEQFKTGLDYFKRSLLLDQSLHDSLSMIVNLNNIGDNYRKTGDYPNAILYTEKALTISRRFNERYQMCSAYKDLSKAYNLSGDYKRAYENLEIGRTLYEELFAQDAAHQSELFQTLFEIERKNNEINQLQSSKKLDTVIKISLASSFILLLILGAAIISRQRLKIRKDREEIDRNKEIFEAQRKLMQVELENTALREKQLHRELEDQSKSLTAHTLNIMGKNKMMEDVQQKLSGLLNEDPAEQRRSGISSR
jgi:tetratricopeptide (TPR) repeat protein